MSSNRKPKLGANGELINLPASAEMTNELLLSSFRSIEAKFKVSGTYKNLDQLLQEYLKKSKSKVLTCVCFGTGTFSGFCDAVKYAATHRQPVDDESMAYMMRAHHGIAMYQLALFKGAIDVIGKHDNLTVRDLSLIEACRKVAGLETVGLCARTRIQRLR